MYKTLDGNNNFSFSRFINNAVPNIALGPRSDDLTVREQDQLFEYQISLFNPSKLDPLAFCMSGIMSSERGSCQIHSALIKNGILSADSPAINTKAITSQFAHQLSMISSFVQKKLVNLLFFWEEEQQRWRVLLEEEKEIKGVIETEREAGGSVGSLEKRLKELEGLIKLKPSLRSAQGRQAEELPVYENVQDRRGL